MDEDFVAGGDDGQGGSESGTPNFGNGKGEVVGEVAGGLIKGAVKGLIKGFFKGAFNSDSDDGNYDFF